MNELLHQMENFTGVMVGATNFMDNLDQAIMRRFTFKLQFDYLGGTVTNAQRIAELEKESSIKHATKKSGRIGF